MKITICGGIAFFDEMLAVKKVLELRGHKVRLPSTEVKNENGELIPVKQYYEIRKNSGDNVAWVWDRKAESIMLHLKKVEWSDAIVVLNYEKNGIKGYVGSNTLIEMGLAFFLGRKIFLFDKIPEIGCKEEILGMKPIVINGRLEEVK